MTGKAVVRRNVQRIVRPFKPILIAACKGLEERIKGLFLLSPSFHLTHRREIERERERARKKEWGFIVLTIHLHLKEICRLWKNPFLYLYSLTSFVCQAHHRPGLIHSPFSKVTLNQSPLPHHSHHPQVTI